MCELKSLHCWENTAILLTFFHIKNFLTIVSFISLSPWNKNSKSDHPVLFNFDFHNAFFWQNINVDISESSRNFLSVSKKLSVNPCDINNDLFDQFIIFILIIWPWPIRLNKIFIPCRFPAAMPLPSSVGSCQTRANVCEVWSGGNPYRRPVLKCNLM